MSQYHEDYMRSVAVLCVDRLSNYKLLDDPALDLWDKERDAFRFNGSAPVISHAPCQQWSKLRKMAIDDQHEKALAFFCLHKVLANGGVFEHPEGSTFFEVAGITPTHSVDQCWFGFPARKRTWLFFHKCKPLPYPLSFDVPRTKVEKITSTMRSRMPEAFCSWLINSVRQTIQQ